MATHYVILRTQSRRSNLAVRTLTIVGHAPLDSPPELAGYLFAPWDIEADPATEYYEVMGALGITEVLARRSEGFNPYLIDDTTISEYLGRSRPIEQISLTPRLKFGTPVCVDWGPFDRIGGRSVGIDFGDSHAVEISLLGAPLVIWPPIQFVTVLGEPPDDAYSDVVYSQVTPRTASGSIRSYSADTIVARRRRGRRGGKKNRRSARSV